MCRDFGQAGLPLLSVPWGPCSPFPWTGLLLGPCPWLRSRLPACLLSRGRFVVQPARLQLGPVPDTLLLPVTQGPSPCASFFTLVKSEVPSRPHPPSGASRPLLPGWARWILYSQDAAFHCVPSTWVHFGAGQLSRLLSSLSPRETHTEQRTSAEWGPTTAFHLNLLYVPSSLLPTLPIPVLHSVARFPSVAQELDQFFWSAAQFLGAQFAPHPLGPAGSQVHLDGVLVCKPRRLLGVVLRRSGVLPGSALRDPQEEQSDLLRQEEEGAASMDKETLPICGA